MDVWRSGTANLIVTKTVTKKGSIYSCPAVAPSAHYRLLHYWTQNLSTPRWWEKETTITKDQSTRLSGHTDCKEKVGDGIELPNLSACKEIDEFWRTLPSHIAEMVQNVKSLIMALFCHLKDPIFSNGFLAAHKFAIHTNHFHKVAATRALQHYVNETLAQALNSRMRDKNNVSSFSSSVRNVDNLFQKLLRSHPEVENYMLKNFQ